MRMYVCSYLCVCCCRRDAGCSRKSRLDCKVSYLAHLSSKSYDHFYVPTAITQLPRFDVTACTFLLSEPKAMYIEVVMFVHETIVDYLWTLY